MSNGDIFPAIGRIAHYVSRHSDTPTVQCCAAMITEVGDFTSHVGLGYKGANAGAYVGLVVFTPRGFRFYTDIPFYAGTPRPAKDPLLPLCGDRSYRDDTWHWPAYVDLTTDD